MSECVIRIVQSQNSMSTLELFTSVCRHEVTSHFLSTIGKFLELGFTFFDLFCLMIQLVILCEMFLVVANLL